MATFQQFRNNIKARFPAIENVNVLKIRAMNIETIFEKSTKYFNVTLDSLRFEIESFTERKFFRDPEYHVIAYPNIEYSFIDEETNTIKNLNGEFFIRRGPGSIFLYVSPPERGGEPVKLEDVLQKAAHTHYVPKNVDTSLIRNIVNQARGIWVVIAKFEYNPSNDANIQIKISEDEMHAEILLTPPLDGGADATIGAMMEVVRAVGISYGVKEEIIDRLEKVPIYNHWIEVAAGKPADEGRNSYVELVVRNKEKKSHTNVIGKTVSTHTWADLVTVTKGEIVARKVLHSDGVEGQTLFGNMIFPVGGTDIIMEGNDNVEISEDNMEAKALVSGSVYVKNNKVFVDKIWEINGDLTLEIGDINFPGSVLIRGNVPDDFIVKVDGNLTILGTVGKSNLYVGGNLEVMNGINGRGEATVEVDGSLVAKFVERVDIRVKNYCIVSESIINCNIVCYNKIVAVTGRGRVSSSKLIAEKEILIKKVGSELGSPSDLRVVSLPDERKKLEDVLEKIKEVTETIEQKKSFFGEGHMQDSFKRLSPKQKDHIKELVADLKESQLEHKRLLSITRALRRKIRESEGDVNIYIADTIQEETKITLNDINITLKQSYPPINFFIKDGKIVNRQITDVMRIIEKNNIDKLFPHAKF